MPEEGVERIIMVSTEHLIVLGAIAAVFGLLLAFVVGRKRRSLAWTMGKGQIALLLLVGTVLGSIYGGITGITEAIGTSSGSPSAPPRWPAPTRSPAALTTLPG